MLIWRERFNIRWASANRESTAVCLSSGENCRLVWSFRFLSNVIIAHSHSRFFNFLLFFVCFYVPLLWCSFRKLSSTNTHNGVSYVFGWIESSAWFEHNFWVKTEPNFLQVFFFRSHRSSIHTHKNFEKISYFLDILHQLKQLKIKEPSHVFACFSSQSLKWMHQTKTNSTEKEHFRRKQFGNKLSLPFAIFIMSLQEM